MNFASPPRIRRKPSLTPMIDVVFLLLVFFMLASRFGADAILPLPLAGGGNKYTGPPRLIDISQSRVLLNGTPVDDLPTALEPLMQSASDIVVLRGQDGAKLQRLVDIAGQLRGAGYNSIVLAE